MKDPSSQQIWKYNEGLNSCLNIVFAMLPKGKGDCVFHSFCSSVLQVNYTIPMPRHIQLTSPLCSRVESLNSLVRSKWQIQGDSAPQWWQTCWWLSPWGKLKGKDASVNTGMSGCLCLAFRHTPLYSLLCSRPTTFCSYLYKLKARHNYSL